MTKNIFLYIIVFLTNISVAQYVNHTNDTGWNLGFNIGGSWQEPQRKNNNSAFNNPFAGFSRGFTLGKGIYEKKDKIFSFDLRFRYLKGTNSGWTATADSFASPYGLYGTSFNLDDSVYAYNNYQMKFNEYTFEGVLTLNKLRERTGLILYGFGGVGLTYYNINRDILNGTTDNTFDGVPYDYSSVTFLSDRQTAIDLKRLSDNNFETEIERNKLKFMPSLGFGIGYQFNERWSMGIEHKITYALTNNINDIDNPQINDKYNYTALKLNFDISSYKQTSSNNEYISENTAPIVNDNPPQNQGRPPSVERANPRNNFHTSDVPTFNFSNSIENLDDNTSSINPYNSTDIANVFKLNGNAQKVTSNEFVLTGSSQTQSGNAFTHNKIDFSKDFKLKFDANLGSFDNTGADGIAMVFHNDPRGVNTIGQSGKYIGAGNISNGIVLEIDTYFNNDVDATSSDHTSIWTTENINNKISSDISFSNLEDGSWHTVEINWNVYTKTLSYTLDGYYAGKVVGDLANKYFGGSSSVYYGYTASTGYYFNIQKIRFENEELKNISEISNGEYLPRSDIEFSVNGYSSKSYRFKNNILYSNINLNPGENIIRVKGINLFGSDFKTTTIYYNAPSLPAPPIVNITVPNSSPHISSSPYSAIHASILNIENRSQITFKINGERIYNFSFNGEYFSANNIPLVNGNNIFQISASNTYGYSSDETIILYSYSLPEPIVDITTPYTNPYNSLNSNTTIRATILNVDNKSNIGLYINGNRSYEFDFSATQFEAKSLSLFPGINKIRVVGKNSSGLAEDNTNIIFNNSLLPNPVVNITSPNKNPYASNNNKTNINADIFNVLSSADILFYINNIKNTNFTFSRNSFEAIRVSLKTGKNYIKIIGANNQGSSFDETIVIYKPPILPLPKVRIVNPNKRPSEVLTRFIKVDANILNVVGKNNITFSVNGDPLTSFNFSGNRFVANNVVLQNGKNIIRIKGQNNQGSAYDESVIFYKPQIMVKPNVSITSPGLSPFNSPSLYVNIRATILNVSTPNNVTFKLNGTLLNNFIFSGNIFEANNILIKEGDNTIIISGKNNVGIDSDKTIISFKKPAQNNPPKIVVSYPSSPTFNTSNKMILISGQIQNVENANDVSVTMNGNSVKNFLFDTYFDDFQCEIQLQNGVNIFNIKAFNNDGKDERIVTIEYAPIECKNPVIQLKSPNSNSITSNSSRGYISAVIENTQNVVFKIDDVASQGFNFDVNNGVFSSMINLSSGIHDYEINAFNTCGSTTEIVSFTYSNLPNDGVNDPRKEELKEEKIKDDNSKSSENEEVNDEKEEVNEKKIKEEKTLLELKQKKAILESQRRKQHQEQQAAEAKRKQQQQEQQAAEAKRKQQQQKQQAAEEQKRKDQEQQAAEAQRKQQQQEQQAAEAQRKQQQQEQQAAEEQRKQQQQEQRPAEEQKRKDQEKLKKQEAEKEKKKAEAAKKKQINNKKTGGR